MNSISTKELKKLLQDKSKNIQIIDVRSKSEWDAGHIEDERVTNQDVNSLIFDSSKFDKNKKIYLICESGGRSSIAYMILGTKGFDCVNVDGGMSSYRNI